MKIINENNKTTPPTKKIALKNWDQYFEGKNLK